MLLRRRPNQSVRAQADEEAQALKDEHVDVLYEVIVGALMIVLGLGVIAAFLYRFTRLFH
jgi:hypothetical protein